MNGETIIIVCEVSHTLRTALNEWQIGDLPSPSPYLGVSPLLFKSLFRQNLERWNLVSLSRSLLWNYGRLRKRQTKGISDSVWQIKTTYYSRFHIFLKTRFRVKFLFVNLSIFIIASLRCWKLMNCDEVHIEKVSHCCATPFFTSRAELSVPRKGVWLLSDRESIPSSCAHSWRSLRGW